MRIEFEAELAATAFGAVCGFSESAQVRCHVGTEAPAENAQLAASAGNGESKKSG